ncbi:MAG: helix-turn-helix domain-containing protein [Pseudobacter sp.]|uniref:helix-turn-helix domain-containing protein n=1 Tax=Pseudobacter sp. TaxID=2045420 RepID=UPI003F7D9450
MQGIDFSDDAFMKWFGTRCVSLRKKIGYTSADKFAYEKGFERAQWGKIERGKTNVQMLTFMRICRALEVTPEKFFSEGK